MYPLVIYPLAPSERAMEYAGVVGIELADMLTLVHEKVHTLEPRVPNQHTFGGDSLQNFIRDHQDELEHLNHQVENLMTMMNEAVMRLQVGQERQCQDLRRVEEMNVELLRWIAALECYVFSSFLPFFTAKS